MAATWLQTLLLSLKRDHVKCRGYRKKIWTETRRDFKELQIALQHKSKLCIHKELRKGDDIG